MFDEIARRAAQRYRSCGMIAWQFARGKLRGDPVYRAVLEGVWLRRGGTLLDVGCGQGLMLALIAEARMAAGAKEAALPEHLVGMETRAKVAAIARRALGREAEIIAADARAETLPAARTILLFDVLQMMPAADQEALLRGLVNALEPGGVLLLRDADADAGWRFSMVKLANRFKALAFGYSSRPFHFRPATGWRELLESQGLAVDARPMGQGTPYGNVLFAAEKRSFG